jgi:hypothetical protein
MPQFRLFIDSNLREPNSTAANARFNLSRDIIGVKTVQVVKCQLANHIHNIGLDQTISVQTDGVMTNVQLIPGFYTPITFVEHLNVQLLSTGITVELLEGGMLNWTVPVGASIEASTSSSCGFTRVYTTGTFITRYWLGNPSCVAFEIPELNHVYSVFAGTSTGITCNPTVIMPLTNGYGFMEQYQPSTPYHIQCDKTNLHCLSVRVCDPSTGLTLDSVYQWSMELLFVTDYK